MARLAGRYGDGFFTNHISWPAHHARQMVALYRRSFEQAGHGTADEAIVGLGGQVFLAPRSQDGRRARAPNAAVA